MSCENSVCKHLIGDSRCSALETNLDGSFGWGHDQFALHIPKLCSVIESFTGDETQIRRRIKGQCNAAHDGKKQGECDDFKEDNFHGASSQY